MSLSKQRRRRRATLIGAGFGVVIIFTFMISLIAPDIGTRSSSSDNSFLTLTPFSNPTPVIIPTPDPNPQLAGALPYIHSGGYFQTFLPAGTDWMVNEDPEYNISPFAGVVIQSGDRLAVIHNYVQQGVEYASLDSLSAGLLTPENFAADWKKYDSWQETGRQIVGDTVAITFNLVSEGANYLGRSVARLDGNRLYVARFVVPANNPALLDLLAELTLPVFKGYPDLQKLAQSWPTYVDQELGFALKHPADWDLVAGGPGRPVTFNAPSSEGKALVRAWMTPNQPLESADQAEAWVSDSEPTATVYGTQPVEREVGAGYQVAYAYRDAAGDPRSGLAVLLNDAHGNLFVASLQFEPPDVNFLDVETLSEETNRLRQALADGFVILPDEARPPAPEAAEPATE